MPAERLIWSGLNTHRAGAQYFFTRMIFSEQIDVNFVRAGVFLVVEDL